MNDLNNTIEQIIKDIKKVGIIDAIGDGVSIQDIKYKILYENRVHVDLVGDHVGKYCYEAYQSKDKVCEGCPLTMTFKDGGIHTTERSLLTENETRYFEITASPLRDSTGKIIAGIEVVRDITDRKRDEEALMTSEEKYRLLFSAEQDAIILVEFETRRIIDANDSALSLYGYSKEEILKLTGPDLSAEPEKSNAAIKEIATKPDKYIHYHTRNHKKKDGTVFPVEISSGTFFFEDKKIVSAMIRDITERQKAELERKHLLTELAQKNKELEQILYITSHDLRSPLVNVEGFSNEVAYSLKELMSHLENEDDPSTVKEKIAPIMKQDIPESLEFIKKSILKMDTLLKCLLNLSRMGRLELNIEDIDMNKMLENIMSTHEFRLSEAGINTEVLELPKCKGDRTQVNQLFSNLLDNSIKYLDPERPGVIKVSGYKENEQSVYCVEDNGIGIAPEYREKIFEIFHQLEPDRVMGDGLGLTIVNRILDRLNGSIWIESELGTGSKFFVSIPS